MATKPIKSISSEKRLQDMLEEAEIELAKIQPQIEKLEKQQEKLKALKLTKQKLITLKLSVQSILQNFSIERSAQKFEEKPADKLREILEASDQNTSRKTSRTSSSTNLLQKSEEVLSTSLGRMFLPDQALEEVEKVLKQKRSTNYEIFRAIVYSGGEATTDQIKGYLVENGIQQPTTGKGFEEVELTDISSRANYLVRKGVVKTTGRGRFASVVGWSDGDV
ncbi:MAG: hypothetical protein KTR14_04890 [Vampirovibrio sp.]|nr:hypothetical protein [Vampirovibrio sp.]